VCPHPDHWFSPWPTTSVGLCASLHRAPAGPPSWSAFEHAGLRVLDRAGRTPCAGAALGMVRSASTSRPVLRWPPQRPAGAVGGDARRSARAAVDVVISCARAASASRAGGRVPRGDQRLDAWPGAAARRCRDRLLGLLRRAGPGGGGLRAPAGGSSTGAWSTTGGPCSGRPLDHLLHAQELRLSPVRLRVDHLWGRPGALATIRHHRVPEFLVVAPRAAGRVVEPGRGLQHRPWTPGFV
jgi:hypothetical protein